MKEIDPYVNFYYKELHSCLHSEEELTIQEKNNKDQYGMGLEIDHLTYMFLASL